MSAGSEPPTGAWRVLLAEAQVLGRGVDAHHFLVDGRALAVVRSKI
ncbi:MAG: hypothetical protein R3B99_10815 [Polyangiales bacterium]